MARHGRPALGLAALLAASAAFAQSPAFAPADRPVPFEVVINGARSGTWLMIERGGSLYAPVDAFQEWRLAIAAEAPRIEFRGQEYRALSAVPGFRAKVDLPNQSVELQFAPQAFATLRMAPQLAAKPKPDPVLTSAFVNYDVSYSRGSPKTGATTGDLGILSEVGLSTGLGVFTTSSAARNLLADRDLALKRGWIRLESTFTRDFPETNRTLRLGDATTKGAMWGRDVFFGGLRFGTNFALTPGFISQPLPQVGGLSAAPSTVELYVNDVLRQVSSVPTGPFVIDNFPVMTGGGEARVVVRDLLGRETVLVQRFFTSSQMLAAGLDDWSVEAGRVREELGNESASYGPGFASGTWRRGMSDTLTVEARAEAGRRARLIGAGMLTVLPWQVVARAALVASDHSELGRGGRWLLGLESQSTSVNFNLEAQRSTRHFTELGQGALPTLKSQYAGNVSYATQGHGTFGLGLALLARHDGTQVRTVSANYSTRVLERSTLTMYATRALRGTTSASGGAFGITFLMPLEANRVASVTGNARAGVRDLYGTVLQNPGIDSPLGWRFLTGLQQDHKRTEGGLYFEGNHGSLAADASYSPQLRALRLGATGGLVLADGKAFASRRVDESFAIAEVKGYPDVGIGLGSNVLARTDPDGIALVPRLLPYMANSIRIDPRELPINAELDSIERAAVPSWRSGVRVTFPVRGGRGALLRIVLDDGGPAPAGAVVSLQGEAETFYVARRGEAFVTGMQADNRLELAWNGQRCKFQVALPPAQPDEIPRVGPIACQGVPR